MDQNIPQQTATVACLDCGKELQPLLRSWCNKCLRAWHMPAGYRNA